MVTSTNEIDHKFYYINKRVFGAVEGRDRTFKYSFFHPFQIRLSDGDSIAGYYYVRTTGLTYKDAMH